MNSYELVLNKLIKKIETLYESEQFRSIVKLFIINPEYLSRRGLSIGSMGVKKLIGADIVLWQRWMEESRKKNRVLMKKHKMTCQEWVDSIDDNKLHYIGEYYTYLTGKEFFKKNGYPRKPFIDWITSHFEEIEDLDMVVGFRLWKSKFIGFFFERIDK